MGQAKSNLLKNLRKKLLVNRPFQLSFLRHACAMATITMLMCFGGARFFIWSFRHKGFRIGLPPTHPFFQLIDQQAATMNWIFLFVAITVFAALMIYGLYLSHRVAGPILRLEKYARVLSEGKDPGSLVFRKKDYFKELEAPMDALARKIHQQKRG